MPTATVDSPTSSDPQEALRTILQLIENGQAVRVFDDRQVVLLAGAEGASTDEIAELFTSIGGGRVAANFWEGFSSGASVDGVDLAALRFGQVMEFEAEGVPRAAVEVWDERREGVRVWQLASTADGWAVDLFATFGDVYAGPLRLLVRSLDENASGYSEVAEALADQRASLDLAPPTEARLELSMELAELPR